VARPLKLFWTFQAAAPSRFSMRRSVLFFLSNEFVGHGTEEKSKPQVQILTQSGPIGLVLDRGAVTIARNTRERANRPHWRDLAAELQSPTPNRVSF